MTSSRTRPIDALQRIMTSFKHFEKKLDKLQDDVNCHGQTLTDLRAMVTNLSGGTILGADNKFKDNRRPLNKNTAIQYEDKISSEEPIKTMKKKAVQPSPTKVKTSYQSQKTKMSPMESPLQPTVTKLEPSQKALRHAQRHKKAEAFRKPATVKTQKLDQRTKLSK
ncbi:unnamed protein product [Chrysodeixis includens]|uniref:Uncharacterized protein n=1 Tax=Chrysodeixis includens TaxID=689277 RepID=A0A9P0FUL6_CHRIL|nr:unnamed protein product [Chrysodeixis includens]